MRDEYPDRYVVTFRGGPWDGAGVLLEENQERLKVVFMAGLRSDEIKEAARTGDLPLCTEERGDYKYRYELVNGTYRYRPLARVR